MRGNYENNTLFPHADKVKKAGVGTVKHKFLITFYENDVIRYKTPYLYAIIETKYKNLLIQNDVEYHVFITKDNICSLLFYDYICKLISYINSQRLFLYYDGNLFYEKGKIIDVISNNNFICPRPLYCSSSGKLKFKMFLSKEISQIITELNSLSSENNNKYISQFRIFMSTIDLAIYENNDTGGIMRKNIMDNFAQVINANEPPIQNTSTSANLFTEKNLGKINYAKFISINKDQSVILLGTEDEIMRTIRFYESLIVHETGAGTSSGQTTSTTPEDKNIYYEGFVVLISAQLLQYCWRIIPKDDTTIKKTFLLKCIQNFIYKLLLLI